MANKQKLINNLVSNIFDLMPPDKQSLTITIEDPQRGEALQIDVKLSYKKIIKGGEKLWQD